MLNWDYDQVQRFGQLWVDFLSRAAAAGAGAASSGAVLGASPAEASRQVRTAVLDSITQQTDQFLRSPQFLEAMKQAMTAGLKAQKQYQDFLTALRHQTQGLAVQDVDALMVLMRMLESRVLDRLEEVHAGIEQILQRLDRLEGDGRVERHQEPEVATPGNGSNK